ncbi:MAG: YdeI family protein [Anaerolineales bacterium]
MEITQTLHVTDPKEWRAWLEKHYQTENEIWLVYYKKHTGKPRIEYNDAVEQALCFGWIDSTAKKLDEDRTAQRFSPRKPKSGYSQANIERLRYLVARGQVIEEVRESLGDILEREFVFPADILEAIQADGQAWSNYQNFSEPYKRIRVAFIEGARKRPEEFQKRLNYFIKMSRENKIFGFGGIEKHF